MAAASIPYSSVILTVSNSSDYVSFFEYYDNGAGAGSFEVAV